MASLACLIQKKNWIVFLPNYKKIRLSYPAKKDLKAIASYTFAHYGVKQKQSYLNLIKQSFKAFALVGNVGKKRDDIALGLYFYTVKKHCVFFRELDDEFVVVRVLHSSMDFKRHF